VNIDNSTWLVRLVLIAVISSDVVTGVAVQACDKTNCVSELESHLAKARVGSGAIQVIMRYLERTKPDDPYEAILDWAKADLPDLDVVRGSLDAEALSVQLGIVHAVHFFLRSLPEADRTTKYLAAMDALGRGDGTNYYTWQLATSARGTINPVFLKDIAIRRMNSSKEHERCQGVLMAVDFANQPDIIAQYRRILTQSANRNDKVTILAVSGSMPKREMALLSLDRLVNDSLAEVREWAARCLRVAIQSKEGLCLDDLYLLLFPLVETQDTQVRVTLGYVAAYLTTDPALMVDEEALNDDVLMGFVKAVTPLRLNANSKVDRQDMVRLWRNWWNKRCGDYTKRMPTPNFCE
jgi:hypothetical protein